MDHRAGHLPTHAALQDMLLLHFDLTSVVLRLVLPIILQLTSFAGPIM